MRLEAPLEVKVKVTITKFRDLPDDLPPAQLEKWKQQARAEIAERFAKHFGDLVIGMAGLSIEGHVQMQGLNFFIGGKAKNA